MIQAWLIGALIEDGQYHEVCLKKLDESISNGSAKAARHSLAEVFHTITGKKGVPPQQASELLQQNFSEVRWTEVTEDDYWQSVKSARTRGVRAAPFSIFSCWGWPNEKMLNESTP